ncbi:MAG TPA: phosphatase PAP2 family protein [Baekduia sp.]
MSFRRPAPPLALAAVSALLLAITGVFAKLIPITQQGDAKTLHGFVELNAPRLTPALDHIAHLADPAPYALWGLILVLVALVRGRWRVALGLPLVFFLAGFTSESLKHLLAGPRVAEWLGHAQIGAASWPSGHSTAAMTMALCAVLAAPPRLRPTVAAIGGAFALAVAYAILTLGWHFPSDVFGGYLVAMTYVMLFIGVVAWSEQRWPSRRGVEGGTRPADVLPALGVALLAAGAAIGLALARPEQLVGYAATHTTFVVGALAIAALAVVLATVTALGFRGPTRTAR